MVVIGKYELVNKLGLLLVLFKWLLLVCVSFSKGLDYFLERTLIGSLIESICVSCPLNDTCKHLFCG